MENNLDKIMERARIPFPKAMTLDEVEDLFSYITTNGAYRFSFKREEHVNIDISSHVNRGSVKLSGLVILIAKPYGTTGFKCELDDKDYRRFKELRFSLTPDWNLQYYQNHGDLYIWDEIRSSVERYFQK